jgi:hypothetical protein
MVANIAARRGASESPRLATAQTTKARLSTGMAHMKNWKPMFPCATDWWSKRGVVARATIARTTAPSRSGQGARLENSHHNRIRGPHRRPPRIPNVSTAGTDQILGRISQPIH